MVSLTLGVVEDTSWERWDLLKNLEWSLKGI